MVSLIKWLTPPIVFLWCFYYFGAYSSITLSNPSAMALRVTIYVIVFYSLYQQFLESVQLTESIFWTLKYLIVPSTLWLWILHYLYDNCNVVLSHHSLTALRIATFFIASFVYIIGHRKWPEESETISVAICFALFTFGLRTAQFQYQKYQRLIWLFQKNELGNLEYFLIGSTFFIIQLLSSSYYNLFPRALISGSLTELNFLREISNTESLTILRYLIINQLLKYFNKSILKAVQYKLIRDYTSKLLESEKVLASVTSLIFTIDSQLLNSNAESPWKYMLTMCFLINCGALCGESV